MITTIQIRDNVKTSLERLKEKNSETYEEIILRLMHTVEEQKRKQRTLLIEGCKAMAEDSLKITKEWEATDSTLDWEWK